jgi:hypothetical protein
VAAQSQHTASHQQILLELVAQDAYRQQWLREYAKIRGYQHDHLVVAAGSPALIDTPYANTGLEVDVCGPDGWEAWIKTSDAWLHLFFEDHLLRTYPECSQSKRLLRLHGGSAICQVFSIPADGVVRPGQIVAAPPSGLTTLECAPRRRARWPGGVPRSPRWVVVGTKRKS